MMNKIKKDNLDKKFNTMKNEASRWLSSWEDLARWERPTRGKFEGDEINDGSLLDYQDNLNNTVQLAIRTFASGMLSGMTSPARKWFKLEVEDKQINELDNVKQWLELAEDAIRNVFAKSNVYGALYSIYEEIGVFATAAAIINTDFDTIIRLRNFTAGEYFLANDNTGRVNSFAREFSMTVAQVVEEFGINNVSSDVKNSYDNNELSKLVVIRHLICPNKYLDTTKKDNKNMLFSSYYWEKGNNEDKFLRESGYNKFPIIAPRWGLATTSDVYGKDSPGWECLGDVKMLQRIEEDELYSIAIGARPARLIDDSIEMFDFLPDGVTRYNSTNPNNVGVRNLDGSNIKLQDIERKIQLVEYRISRTFYADLFMMLTNMDDRQRTATEVMQRVEEKMLVLAPALERINSEAINPLIDITFETLLNNGLLPEPPQELQGVDLNIEYISTIAQAQKMVGTNSIEQFLGFTGNIAAVSPTVIDTIDFDEAIIQYGRKLGVSESIIRGKQEVAAMRDARAAQQAQAQMQQQAQSMIEGAKVLADTEIKDNTALTALFGGGM